MEGRRGREWKLRRHEILNAAQKVFAKEGYSNATMAQIASEAEFGVGTLYQFFRSKQDLFVTVILREAEAYVEGLKKLLITSSLWKEQLQSFIAYKLSWVEARPNLQRLLMEVFYTPIPNVTPRIINRLKEIHTKNIFQIRDIFIQANKTDNLDFDPELMALVVVGTTDAMANEWSIGSKVLKKSPGEYVPEILKGVLGGKNGA